MNFIRRIAELPGDLLCVLGKHKAAPLVAEILSGCCEESCFDHPEKSEVLESVSLGQYCVRCWVDVPEPI